MGHNVRQRRGAPAPLIGRVRGSLYATIPVKREIAVKDRLDVEYDVFETATASPNRGERVVIVSPRKEDGKLDIRGIGKVLVGKLVGVDPTGKVPWEKGTGRVVIRVKKVEEPEENEGGE